jgi:hypothetical protein
MNLEPPQPPESPLKKLVELRWQRDVVARWLDCVQLTDESRSELREMLAQVDAQLRGLESGDFRDGRANLKQAG